MTLATTENKTETFKGGTNSSEGRSHPNSKMIAALAVHFGDINPATFREYTFEQSPTEFGAAKADLRIFDASGNMLFLGREFRSGQFSFWRPSHVSTAPTAMARP